MRRAIVLGGSIAGLTAARVLSDHADRVVIIEPDDPNLAAGVRHGVPQGTQVHAVLSMGSELLERWLPGLTDELIADGAIFSCGDQIEHYVDGVLKVCAAETTISLTRPMLEHHIRRRVLANDKLSVVQGRAQGLLFAGQRVTGVQYVPAESTDSETLMADLVVDATGRGTQLDRWLSEGGWSPPAMERMNLQLGFATALFKSDGVLPEFNVVQALPSPKALDDWFTAVRVEDDRWMVVLAAYGQEHRPTRDAEEFVRRCKTGAIPSIREIVSQCRMDGEVTTYTVADSRRRHFTALPRFPAGLVAVGDAVASFNPMYGQGMAVAVLQAYCLSAYLRSGAGLDEPARDYFRRVKVFVDAAWGLSTLMDLGLSHVDGSYPKGSRFARRYAELINQATFTDPDLHRLFLEVAHLRKHPKVLSRPGTVAAVARALLVARLSSPRATV